MFSNEIMNEVKVSKAELLTAIKANLAKHQSALSELKASRREKISNYFSKTLNKIANESGFQPDLPKFPLPEDRTNEYQTAIKMVEMSVSDTIVITASQFDRLVMDNWDWKKELLQTSMFYSN